MSDHNDYIQSASPGLEKPEHDAPREYLTEQAQGANYYPQETYAEPFDVLREGGDPVEEEAHYSNLHQMPLRQSQEVSAEESCLLDDSSQVQNMYHTQRDTSSMKRLPFQNFRVVTSDSVIRQEEEDDQPSLQSPAPQVIHSNQQSIDEPCDKSSENRPLQPPIPHAEDPHPQAQGREPAREPNEPTMSRSPEILRSNSHRSPMKQPQNPLFNDFSKYLNTDREHHQMRQQELLVEEAHDNTFTQEPEPLQMAPPSKAGYHKSEHKARPKKIIDLSEMLPLDRNEDMEFTESKIRSGYISKTPDKQAPSRCKSQQTFNGYIAPTEIAAHIEKMSRRTPFRQQQNASPFQQAPNFCRQNMSPIGDGLMGSRNFGQSDFMMQHQFNQTALIDQSFRNQAPLQQNPMSQSMSMMVAQQQQQQSHMNSHQQSLRLAPQMNPERESMVLQTPGSMRGSYMREMQQQFTPHQHPEMRESSEYFNPFFQSQIDELKKTIAKLKQQESKNEVQIIDLKNDLEEATQRHKEAEDRYEDIKTTSNQQNQQFDALREELNDTLASGKELQKEVDSLKKKNADLTKQLEALTSSQKTQQDTVPLEQFAKLEAQLKHKTDINFQLTVELGSLREENAEIKENLDLQKESFEERMAAQRERSAEEYQAMEHQLEMFKVEQQTSIAADKEKIEELMQKIKDLNEEKERAESKYAFELKEKQEQFEQAQKMCDKQKQDLTQLTASYQALNSQLDTLHHGLESRHHSPISSTSIPKARSRVSSTAKGELKRDPSNFARNCTRDHSNENIGGGATTPMSSKRKALNQPLSRKESPLPQGETSASRRELKPGEKLTSSPLRTGGGFNLSKRIETIVNVGDAPSSSRINSARGMPFLSKQKTEAGFGLSQNRTESRRILTKSRAGFDPKEPEVDLKNTESVRSSTSMLPSTQQRTKLSSQGIAAAVGGQPTYLRGTKTSNMRASMNKSQSSNIGSRLITQRRKQNSFVGSSSEFLPLRSARNTNPAHAVVNRVRETATHQTINHEDHRSPLEAEPQQQKLRQFDSGQQSSRNCEWKKPGEKQMAMTNNAKPSHYYLDLSHPEQAPAAEEKQTKVPQHHYRPSLNSSQLSQQIPQKTGNNFPEVQTPSDLVAGGDTSMISAATPMAVAPEKVFQEIQNTSKPTLGDLSNQVPASLQLTPSEVGKSPHQMMDMKKKLQSIQTGKAYLEKKIMEYESRLKQMKMKKEKRTQETFLKQM